MWSLWLYFLVAVEHSVEPVHPNLTAPVFSHFIASVFFFTYVEGMNIFCRQRQGSLDFENWKRWVLLLGAVRGALWLRCSGLGAPVCFWRWGFGIPKERIPPGWLQRLAQAAWRKAVGTLRLSSGWSCAASWGREGLGGQAQRPLLAGRRWSQHRGGNLCFCCLLTMSSFNPIKSDLLYKVSNIPNKRMERLRHREVA